MKLMLLEILDYTDWVYYQVLVSLFLASGNPYKPLFLRGVSWGVVGCLAMKYAFIHLYMDDMFELPKTQCWHVGINYLQYMSVTRHQGLSKDPFEPVVQDVCCKSYVANG